MKNLEPLIELAKELPKEVKDNALNLLDKMGSTIEGISDTPVEWRPDIAKVVQAMSDRSKLPKGAGPGDILIGEDILEQPATVIPLRMWDARQYWDPDPNENKMLCSSPDAVMGYLGYVCKECPHSKWEDGKSDCSKIKQGSFITADLSTFFILNFAKTNYTAGNEFQSKMKKAGVSTFKRFYELKTETSKQYKNVEAIVITPPQSNRVDDKLHPFLQALFDRFSSDRETHLAAFHLMAKTKGEKNQALLGSDQGDAPALTSNVVAATETAEQSKMASKYEM